MKLSALDPQDPSKTRQRKTDNSPAIACSNGHSLKGPGTTDLLSPELVQPGLGLVCIIYQPIGQTAETEPRIKLNKFGLEIRPPLAQDDSPTAKVKGGEPILNTHEVGHLVREPTNEKGIVVSLLLVSGGRHCEGS